MILVVFGTRPEALKLQGPVEQARAMHLGVHVHCTNQQPDLLDPEVLPWETSGPLTPSLLSEAHFMVVQGDTRTAFLSAVQAYEAGVPVFHVEAGVRSGDLTSPCPEEGYRKMITQLSKWHACTTQRNALALSGLNTRVTGSPIVLSVQGRAAAPYRHPEAGPLLLLTLHRRENKPHFHHILLGVQKAIASRAMNYIWYAHPNGWASNARPVGMVFTPPANAERFACVLASSSVVVTDSGGVQEEANALGIPCVVTRTVTDRPESVGEGGAILAGVTEAGVQTAISLALNIDPAAIKRDCFGDATASRKIAQWWAELT